jgi:hypothetical protein
LFVGIAVAALVVAACGGGGDDDDDDAGAGDNRQASTERTPRPTRTPKPQDPRDLVQLPEDACDLLDEQEVLAFSSELQPADPLAGDPDVWKGCQWQYNAGRDWGTLSVQVRKFYTSETFESARATLEERLRSATSEKVDGVGELSVLQTYAGAQIELTALLQDRIVTVGWTNPESESKKDLLRQTVQKVIDRLP